MPKKTVTLLGVLLTLSPVALAETGKRTVTAMISYDSGLLSTPDGVSAVLDSIETQAERACRTRTPVYGTPMTDEVCVESIISAAVNRILDVQSLHDSETARIFASLTGAPEQR